MHDFANELNKIMIIKNVVIEKTFKSVSLKDFFYNLR